MTGCVFLLILFDMRETLLNILQIILSLLIFVVWAILNHFVHERN